MKCEIIELIGKVKQRFTLVVANLKYGSQGSFKLDGKNIETELTEKLESRKSILAKVTELKIYSKHKPIEEYLNYFPKIEILEWRGSVKLRFPKMNKYLNLKTIYLDGLGKNSILVNIDTIPNLVELRIATFSFNNPIDIGPFDDIVNCKKLNTLFIGNVMAKDLEVRKLGQMTQLSLLRLHQKIEFETLAFLSVQLPNTKSPELKAWQHINSIKGDIKINGKRKPYLDSTKDSNKISKFEDQFEKLKLKYAK